VLSMAQSRLPVAMEIESGHLGFDLRPQEGSGEAAAGLAISPASVSGSASRNGGADVNPRAPREKPAEQPRRANTKTRRRTSVLTISLHTVALEPHCNDHPVTLTVVDNVGGTSRT
jgi:hypothetical protein